LFIKISSHSRPEIGRYEWILGISTFKPSEFLPSFFAEFCWVSHGEKSHTSGSSQVEGIDPKLFEVE